MPKTVSNLRTSVHSFLQSRESTTWLPSIFNINNNNNEQFSSVCADLIAHSSEFHRDGAMYAKVLLPKVVVVIVGFCSSSWSPERSDLAGM